MKALYALPLLLAVCCVPARTQPAQAPKDSTRPEGAQLPSSIPNGEHKKDSGPLTWISSDFNPKSLFWTQGRFVPVGDRKYQGDAHVVTILCTAREYECLEIDGMSPAGNMEQVWIEEFKAVTWDKDGILATGRSLDTCTDETLKIRFSPPSVVIINSPVLPMTAGCRKVNDSMDKLTGKSGGTITAQMEQDELVPTRTLLPWSDVNLNSGNASKPAQPEKP